MVPGIGIEGIVSHAHLCYKQDYLMLGVGHLI